LCLKRRSRDVWKKIERWIVWLIIVFTIVAPIVCYIFADELGMVRSTDGEDYYPPCPRC
jgi:hypothetical protein